MDNEELKEQIDGIVSKFTPEYLEELKETCYFDDRKYPENFSNWYYSIKDFGKFRHVEIIANQIFSQDDVDIMQKTDNYKDVDWEEWYKILWDTLCKMEPHKLYNIKNGCFSNKFDFSTCVTNKMDLAKNLFKINYESHLMDTGGYTELVVRELIPYDSSKIATIYNGMPLREEVRVFYNMDTNQIEYMVDYWDYKYCKDRLYNKNDQLIFDWFHNKLKKRHEQHIQELNKMKIFIKDNIDTLKIEGLEGVWSIDFMLVTDESKYKGVWLIDMARGFRSTYWNPAKLKPETRKTLIY